MDLVVTTDDELYLWIKSSNPVEIFLSASPSIVFQLAIAAADPNSIMQQMINNDAKRPKKYITMEGLFKTIIN